MPVSDSKLGELSKLRNRLLELEVLLKEERKVTARLRLQSEKKNEQIAIANAEITAEAERFRWKKEELLYAIKNNEQDAKSRIAFLKFDERHILEELAESDLTQHHNERLHAQLKELSAEHNQVSLTFSLELEKRKQKDFGTRMAMEEMLRKMLKNVDATNQLEGVSKLQLEASHANLENERIRTEFSIREAKTEALIRQQKHSYDQLMRVKIERDVMAASTEVQEDNIQKMTQQNAINDIKVQRLGKQLQRLKDEVESLKLTMHDKQELDQRCLKTKKLIDIEHEQVQAWKSATLRLCKKLLNNCSHIAEMGRTRDNNKLTQQLDTLVGVSKDELHAGQNIQEAAALQRAEQTQDETIAEGRVHFRETDQDKDYEAVWRCPAIGKTTQRMNTGKLGTRTDWRRARAKTCDEGSSIPHQQSASAAVFASTGAYKSFSM
jgi:hypothetical protein